MRIEHDDNAPPPFALRCAALMMGMRFAVRIMTGYCFVQGISIILGGDERFANSSYSYALQIPGAPWSWGAMLIGCGVLSQIGMLTKNDTVTAAGMCLAAFWSIFFALVFARAAISIPEANYTAMWVYGKDGILFLTAGIVYYSTAYRRDHH